MMRFGLVWFEFIFAAFSEPAKSGFCFPACIQWSLKLESSLFLLCVFWLSKFLSISDIWLPGGSDSLST